MAPNSVLASHSTSLRQPAETSATSTSMRLTILSAALALFALGASANGAAASPSLAERSIKPTCPGKRLLGGEVPGCYGT
jgi:hypothetical protein